MGMLMRENVAIVAIGQATRHKRALPRVAVNRRSVFLKVRQRKRMDKALDYKSVGLLAHV